MPVASIASGIDEGLDGTRQFVQTFIEPAPLPPFVTRFPHRQPYRSIETVTHAHDDAACDFEILLDPFETFFRCHFPLIIILVLPCRAHRLRVGSSIPF